MSIDFIERRLDELRAEGRLRRVPKGIYTYEVDLSSNDYLGLASRTDLCEHHSEAWTSSASRLLAANQGAYNRLENTLDRQYNKRSLLFNSGYHANVGCIQALSMPEVLFATDKLIHASVIDGIRLGRAEYQRFRHNDIDALRRIVEKNADKYGRIIVVTEGIFSMDGDRAPLREIVELKHEFPDKVLIYLDEAHSLGVLGQHGLGLAEELGLIDEVDIIIGTFGKALASAGAFVATTPLLHSWLLNSARSFIFSTALPPVVVEHTSQMFELMQQADVERKHLHEISARFRRGLEEITGEKSVSQSQIVPLIVGSAERAVTLSAQLRERGYVALPIRRPTVPPGTERIRFSLHAGLTEQQIDELLAAIAELI